MNRLTFAKLANKTFILAVLLVGTTTSAFAQGGDIARADWSDKLPLYFFVITLAVIVDFFVIRKYLNDHNENRERIQ